MLQITQNRMCTSIHDFMLIQGSVIFARSEGRPLRDDCKENRVSFFIFESMLVTRF